MNLLWIQSHPPLCSGRSITERRLKGYDNSLKKTGTIEAYESILNEWIHEGVIKSVKVQS